MLDDMIVVAIIIVRYARSVAMILVLCRRVSVERQHHVREIEKLDPIN